MIPFWDTYSVSPYALHTRARSPLSIHTPEMNWPLLFPRARPLAVRQGWVYLMTGD